MRPVPVRALAVIAATLPWGAASACAGDGDADATLVRDSSGVRIVEHGPVPAATPRWTLEEPPEAVIGADSETDPAHQFTEVRGAVRLSDGRLVVGDWGTKEARYFDPAGRHVQTVGGAGEGPGELRFLYHVDRLPGDTLVVGGWPIGTRYWFDENGAFIRNEILGPWFPGTLGRTLPDGSLIVDSYDGRSYGNVVENWAANGPDEDLLPEGVIELVSRDGATTDTLATIVGERWHKTGELRVNFATHALPYSPRGLVTFSAGHVLTGYNRDAEVRSYGLDGSLDRIVRWRAEPVPVAADDRSLYRDTLMLRLPDPFVPNYRRWLSEVDFPEDKPAFSSLVSDERGYLWVRPSTESGAERVAWTVFAPDGTLAATVEAPARLRILDVDATHVVGTWKDELDVAYVGSYRIRR